MNYTRRSSSNNLVRQVLKEIIAEPPSSSRKSAELEQIKMNEAVTYLERKIERQQSEIKILSEQLGKEIETKEHLIGLVNEEKEKNGKLSSHLSNSNKVAAEMKKKMAKMEGVEAKEGKAREEYELKLAKGRDMLRKKEEQLAKAHSKIEELQAGSANIAEIEKELKELREKVVVMSEREGELMKEIESLGEQLEQEKEKNKAKDETILFSEQHLRRLRAEYEQFQYQQYKQQQEWKSIQLQMKALLQKQNEEIKILHYQLDCRQGSHPDTSIEKSSIRSFPEKPEWQLCLFKNELKRAIALHIRDPSLRHKLESDILVIFQAIETSFNGILSQVMSEIQ